MQVWVSVRFRPPSLLILITSVHCAASFISFTENSNATPEMTYLKFLGSTGSTVLEKRYLSFDRSTTRALPWHRHQPSFWLEVPFFGGFSELHSILSIFFVKRSFTLSILSIVLDLLQILLPGWQHDFADCRILIWDIINIFRDFSHFSDVFWFIWFKISFPSSFLSFRSRCRGCLSLHGVACAMHTIVGRCCCRCCWVDSRWPFDLSNLIL